MRKSMGAVSEKHQDQFSIGDLDDDDEGLWINGKRLRRYVQGGRSLLITLRTSADNSGVVPRERSERIFVPNRLLLVGRKSPGFAQTYPKP
jgi:hypothetical protein